MKIQLANVMLSSPTPPSSFPLTSETAYDVTVTMVTYNRAELALRCLQELRHTTARPFHLTVVDNGSAPDFQDALRQLHVSGGIDTLVCHQRNMGVSVAANTGWDSTQSRYYVKMDSDIMVKASGWLDELVNLAEEGSFWATAYRLCSWHETQQAVLASGRAYQATGAAGGGCILIPRTTFDTVGYWNEDYIYGWEDLEYGNRVHLANGSLAYVADESQVDHLGPEQDTRLPGYQDTKDARAATTQGPKALFLLNTTMFELGLRPVKVIRKFLPRQNANGLVTYIQNPEYKPIITRQNIFRQQFIQKEDGEDLYLDLPFLEK